MSRAGLITSRSDKSSVADGIWGPRFEEYSTQDFEPYETEPDAETEGFYDKYQAFHLKTVQNSLFGLDPRNPPEDMIRLGALVYGMGRYSDLNKKCSIFKHYYGFVCVRHLIQGACYTLLSQSGNLDRLEGLPRNATWGEMSRALAFNAMDVTAEMAQDDDDIFEMFLDTLSGASSNQGQEMEESYALIILNLLWFDRNSFMILCSRGLLPGCALLLLATYRFLLKGFDKHRVSTTILLLRDLIFRLFLVGSTRDREILQVVCVPALQKSIAGPLGDRAYCFLSTEDSRMVRRAFSGLLIVWQEVPPSSAYISTFVLNGLLKFVLRLSISDPGATPQEQIDIAHTTLKLYWLMFEHHGRYLWPTEHPRFRLYGINIITFLVFVQTKHLRTSKDQYEFSRMLAELDTIALLGRVWLLSGLGLGMSDRELYLEDRINTEHIEALLKNSLPLVEPLSNSVVAASRLFEESEIEWAKSAGQWDRHTTTTTHAKDE
ncbi:hypothetical protein FRC12_002519 [Ceratobasidium sp. 428]|nr:hypothetical protein FRC12_002519 [Ceratobasidium sp. 428]